MKQYSTLNVLISNSPEVLQVSKATTKFQHFIKSVKILIGIIKK